MPRFLRICLMPIFLWLSAIAAPALEVTLVPSDPIVKIDFPKGFNVTEIKRGVEAKTSDGEVFVWFEVYSPNEYDTLVREHEQYFTKQGVVIRGEPRIAQDSGANHSVKATDFPATWKGKPTVLRYIAYDFKLPSGKQVLMSYWASPEGDKAHDAAMQRLIASMKAAK